MPSAPDSPDEASPKGSAPDGAPLTVEELASRAGMTVRNVRFYAARRLLPPPVLRGRVGYYGPAHLARLELIRELQAHGYTLAAIERSLERLPEDASPEEVALHKALLAPWVPGRPEQVSRARLEAYAGRRLDDEELGALVGLGIVEAGPKEGVFLVTPALLGLGLQVLELKAPRRALVGVQRIFQTHARAMVDELDELFRKEIWSRYRSGARTPEQVEALRVLVERMKPLLVQSLGAAFERAVSEDRRRRALRG